MNEKLNQNNNACCKCDGTGMILTMVQQDTMLIRKIVKCVECSGTGHAISENKK